MSSNEYVKTEDGWYRCDLCGFTTAHENRAQRHMVKSHQHEPYPEPPVLAEKWRPTASEKASKPKSAGKPDKEVK